MASRKPLFSVLGKIEQCQTGDLLDSGTIDWANPGAIGSGTRNTVAGTTGSFNGQLSVLNSGAANVSIVPGTYPAFQYSANTVDFRDTGGTTSFRINPDFYGVKVFGAAAFIINDGPTMPSLGSAYSNTSIEMLVTSGRLQPVLYNFSGFGGVDAVNFRIYQGSFFGTKYGFTLDVSTLSADRGWKFPNASPAVGNVPRFADTAGTIAYSTGLTIDGSGNVTAPSYRLSALNSAPASATATGTLGEIRFANGFVYLCVATNTWQRAALSTW
jgi:hypothetical protein